MTSPGMPLPSSQSPMPASPAPGATVSSAAAASPADPGTVFPMANIREAKATASSLILKSRMWWAALACVVIAVWLTWLSLPSRGPAIVIRFPDGHGIKAGDAIRHRGIEAGIVERVSLSEDLSQITATVILTPGAAGLAREGTRFWIVRPLVSLDGVSGLETAVGAKYIGVSPGDPSSAGQSSFDGLSAAPPDENSGEGIDIVLRSDARHGVSAGAPVSWRGMEVGRILSLNLSPDARFVDLHAQISADYRRLLRPTSQFWVTSGLGVDIGLSGVRLNADSLSTVVRGGVSFATPTVGKDKAPVTPGQIFKLHGKLDPAWLTAASSLPLIDFELPPTVTVRVTRKTSLLGISRNRKFMANGLLLTTKGGIPKILTASNIFPAPASDSDSAEQKPSAAEYEIRSSLTESTVTVLSTRRGDGSDGGFAWLPCAEAGDTIPGADMSILREPLQPEECCLCRSVKSDDETSSVIQSIGRDQLKATDTLWSVTTDSGDLSPWHGAPVISMQDGKVIGVFIAGKTGPMIAPYRQR